MNVYALFGVEPEIQAYAMARYSRSSGSMAESIRDLTAEKAEEFLNTFYFEYGHRSIADMAHLTFALEDVSILAAIRIVDEQLWDGQERSTRYQSFYPMGSLVTDMEEVPDQIRAPADFQYRFSLKETEPSYLIPPEVETLPKYPPKNRLTDKRATRSVATHHFRKNYDQLLGLYRILTSGMTELLEEAYPRPESMTRGEYRRTLRARAFDVARYALPLGTLTSLGQVVSARVLENQISRLLGESYAEVQKVGAALREACQRPALNPVREGLEPLALAPTLVKYTQPVPYPGTMRREMARCAEELLPPEEPDRSRVVELAAPESPEEEAVATLLYRADPRGRSYRQVQRVVQGLSTEQRKEVLELAMRDRGRHDELPRELRAGYQLKFDILMDIGAFRDLHRHRRCIQIIQEFTPEHGYDNPIDIMRIGLGNQSRESDPRLESLAADYRRTMDDAAMATRWLSQELGPTRSTAAVYALPLAFRTRALFKMDVAEAAYIIELRTGVGGHFSYRHVAWGMLQELKKAMPSFAAHVRATDPHQVSDILQR